MSAEIILENLSDEDLGRLVRQSLDVLTEGDGLRRVWTTTAALALVAYCREAGSSSSSFRMQADIAGVAAGNWLVSVRQVGEAEGPDEDTPHVLAGELWPDRIEQAVGAFRRLTYLSVGSEQDTVAS